MNFFRQDHTNQIFIDIISNLSIQKYIIDTIGFLTENIVHSLQHHQ